jgi:hypothetical protein
VARLWAVLLLGALASGCATATFTLTEKDTGLAGHYILAHEDGWPISNKRKAIQFEDYAGYIKRTILAKLDQHACARWKEHQPLRILLFVHGGLNGYATDFDRMRGLMRGTEDGTPPLFPRTFYFPIFVNWNSALGDSILDDLVLIRFGKRLPWWAGLPTAPFVLAGRLAASVFNTPNAWWANAQNFREMAPGPSEWVETIAMLPIRGLTTPVVQTFGTSAWEIMKRRADLLVARHIDANPAHAPEGAAHTLLEELAPRIGPGPTWRIAPGACEIEQRPIAQVPVKVTVVGHSMGAIVLNRLLAARHDLPLEHIVYLAPASSIDEVEGLARPYLRTHPGATFWLFTLSRPDEARERDPTGLLPRGTLLVWVDSFFEPITAPGQMRAGRLKSYQAYYENLPPEPRVKVYPMSGRQPNEPTAHGQFDDPPYLTRILCTVDPGAFRVPGFCDPQRFAAPMAIHAK